MGTQNWQKLLMPYHQAVDELLLKINQLKDQSIQMGKISPIESVVGRVKSISSILEKINKYDFPMEDLEEKIMDIGGIRIICQFIEDIYQVANMFYDRNGKDLTVVKIKNYLEGIDQSHFQSGLGVPKASGYQSYHIIIRYPVFTSFGYREVLMEIQIRTLAMNFWAIIEHSLNYKYKGKLPENIKERLTNTALTVGQLDHEMSIIRDEILVAQKLFKMKSGTVNDILDNINNLHKLHQDQKAIDFEKEFENLSEKEDLIQLILLKKELQAEVGQIKDSV